MSEHSQIRARDLMQKQVVTLRPDASLREALSTLEEHEITGAPVVDASGRPVGFLTTRDIASPDHLEGGGLAGRRDMGLAELPSDELDEGMLDEDTILERDDYSPAVLGRGSVQDWMSEDVTSVEPGDDLRSICRVMSENSIHRVLVLEEGRIAGIVTTMDVVRHLAR
jgi:CBS domain-containing protein